MISKRKGMHRLLGGRNEVEEAQAMVSRKRATYVTSFARVCVVMGCTLVCVANNSRILDSFGININYTTTDEMEIRRISSDVDVALAFGTNQTSTTATTPTHWRDEKVSEHQAHKLRLMEELWNEKFPGTRSCRRIPHSLNYSQFQDYCPTRSTQDSNSTAMRIALYNPFYKDRIVCGHTIGARKITVVVDDGHDIQQTNCILDNHPIFGMAQHTRLYPVIPSQAASAELEPIAILERDHPDGKPRPFQDCNIPCHITNHGGILQNVVIRGTNWTFVKSMEARHYYPELEYDKTAHRTNNYFATTSFQSEIPMPYFSFAEYNLHEQPPVQYGRVITGAVNVAKNCNSKNNRERVVEDLIKYKDLIRVDSVGKCLNNKPWPVSKHGRKTWTKNDVMRQYLFYLAFENQNEDDYITEKLWGALSQGVVPVYLGGDNIHDHVPPHSIINVKDFNSTYDLAVYLNKVANNATLYNEYHKWRQGPLPDTFLEKYNFTRTHSTCRICRWAFAKQYGLAWDHEYQTIRDEETQLSRSVCYTNRTSLLTRPFAESWDRAEPQQKKEEKKKSWFSCFFTRHAAEPERPPVLDDNGEEAEQHEICQPGQPSTITLLGGTLRRTIQNRDGVMDLFLEPSHDNVNNGATTTTNTPVYDPLVLQLEIPTMMQQVVANVSTVANVTTVANVSTIAIERKSDHQYWIQDNVTRITILCSGKDVTLETKDKEGPVLLQVRIPDPSTPLYMRFIIEDINTFHQSGLTEPQHFAATMTDDWMTPIERFRLPPATRGGGMGTTSSISHDVVETIAANHEQQQQGGEERAPTGRAYRAISGDSDEETPAPTAEYNFRVERMPYTGKPASKSQVTDPDVKEASIPWQHRKIPSQPKTIPARPARLRRQRKVLRHA